MSTDRSTTVADGDIGWMECANQYFMTSYLIDMTGLSVGSFLSSTACGCLLGMTQASDK